MRKNVREKRTASRLHKELLKHIVNNAIQLDLTTERTKIESSHMEEDRPEQDERRKSTRLQTRSRRLSTGTEDSPVTSKAGKRRREPEDTEMATKQRKGEDDNPEPTNAEIMKAVNNIAAKFDDLASKRDLERVEKDLHNKLHEKARETNQQIRTNQRMIHEVSAEITEHRAAIARLEERVQRQEGRTVGNQVAASKRQESQQGAYMRARRSFRIWPVEKVPGEEIETGIKKFFQTNMRVPASLTNTLNIDTVRRAVEQPARSKIRSEIIVTFAEREERDTVKSYARELAYMGGMASLRLEIPEHLKGHHKILEEQAYAMIELYGREVKRNIKFDDRANDLMMDIKLPQSTKWHNITIRQAIEARKVKEERDAIAIRMAGADKPVDKDKNKALMLTLSPGAVSRSSYIGALANAGNATPVSNNGPGLSMFSKSVPVVGEEEDEEEVSILRGGNDSNRS